MEEVCKLNIFHASLAHPALLQEARRELDGTWFAKMAKSDSIVRRLLLAKVEQKPLGLNLGGSSIISTLKQLRDDKVKDIKAQGAHDEERR